MHPSDSLFRLIKALTKGEMRFFRKFASRNAVGEELLYLQLFDRLWKAKAYEEAEEKAWLATQGCASESFASAKKFLATRILDAMRELQNGRHHSSQVRNALADAEFLLSKKLVKESRKALERAKKKAEEYELHAAMLEIAELEASNLVRHDPKLDLESVEAANARAASILETMTNLHVLQAESNWLMTTARLQHVVRDIAEKQAIANRVSAEVFQANYPGFKLQYLALRIQATAASLRKESVLHWRYRGAILALWDRFEELRDSDPLAYGISLANYLASCCDSREYESMPDKLGLLRSLKSRNPLEKAEFDWNYRYYELLYLCNTGGWDAAVDCVEALKKILEDPPETMSLARILSIRLNIGIVYLMRKMFADARVQLDEILKEDRKPHRKDVVQIARLLFAVVHYELGNGDWLADHFLPNSHRKFQRQSTLGAFERELLKGLHRLASTPNKVAKDAEFRRLHEAMASFPDEAGIHELRWWLQGKLK